MSGALARRRRPGDLPERMDDPGLAPDEHRRALDGLARLNAAGGTAAALWSRLAPLARRQAAPLRLLDVACGGGDVSLSLAGRARRAGHPLELWLCDASPTALASARSLADARRIPVHHELCDVLADDDRLAELAQGKDAVICTLFLHHLEDPQAEALLRTLGRARPRMLLIDDLDRTRTGHVLAWLGTRLLSRSAVVHHDGPVSVARAFRVHEVEALAARAGLVGARTTRRWPARWQLCWSPDP